MGDSKTPTDSRPRTPNREAKENFKVIVRVRPPLPRELNSAFGFFNCITVNHMKVSAVEYFGSAATADAKAEDIETNPAVAYVNEYTFDHVFDIDCSQEFVYGVAAKPAVMSILEGYNATLLAYGQTGTGKTYTMEGFSSDDEARGIVPRSIEDVFSYAESMREREGSYSVKVSYLQIYNEVISDLIRAERSNLQIREEKKRGVFVEGLSEWAVRSPSEIYELIVQGQQSRTTAATKLNDVSSRSHAVFIITVEQVSAKKGRQTKLGKLNLVDLAGSERLRVSGATGQRLQESKKINQSLSALGKVIVALTDSRPRTHIPYRDSKLTRLLEDSLGGNCKTTMMAMISPAQDSISETLSTLKFANSAKQIKNAPTVNEECDDKTIIKRYEREILRLRAELESNGHSGVDRQKLLVLEDEKRIAEADKAAAIEALEFRSREFLMEKEQKKRLEDKVKALKLQVSGVGGQHRPEVEAQIEQSRLDWEGKLQEIEKDRQQLEEDRAQIDRYKQLLLRQRDIMIALTSRLNERDNSILQYQATLDDLEARNQELTDQLNLKSERVDLLERQLNRAQTLHDDLYEISKPEAIFNISDELEGVSRKWNSSPSEAASTDSTKENTSKVYCEKLMQANGLLKGFIQTKILGHLKQIQASIQNGVYQYSRVIYDVQALQSAAAAAVSMVPTSEAEPRALSHESFSARNEGYRVEEADYVRPLTVDEMIKLKRLELQRRAKHS